MKPCPLKPRLKVSINPRTPPRIGCASGVTVQPDHCRTTPYILEGGQQPGDYPGHVPQELPGVTYVVALRPVGSPIPIMKELWGVCWQ